MLEESHKTSRKIRMQLLAIIFDRGSIKNVSEILRGNHVHFHFVCMAEGTASSEILNVLGLSSVDKAVAICVESESVICKLMPVLTEKAGLKKAGHGIAFTIPLSGISNSVVQILDTRLDESDAEKENKEEPMSTAANYDLILSVVNKGYCDEVVSAAKISGATGGTVLLARKIGLNEDTKFLGISIQDEKEIVAILCARTVKQEIMKSISHACGLRSPAGGWVFSLPVDKVAGLNI
ncbi:MAG: hypothetical protein LBS62_06135 [Clostridiales bacterium]|jgi:hypothetical protein|nr:hypothetical protein [Clostridiales bacterium]